MSERDIAPTPWIIYGTAWKRDATTRLVSAALRAGFTAIDTANQPRHYEEALVGDALSVEGTDRNAVWLQTKFTPLDGHDQRVPYDPRDDLASQVRQSFVSSLDHLATDYVDSYLLHGPYSFPGLGEEDYEVWRAIEELYRSGQARMIGVSNVNALQLAELLSRSDVPPMVVQNRCFASRGWDRDVRALCRTHAIMYQGFSLLTANPEVVSHPEVRSIARRLGVGPAEIVFRFAVELGIVPLTGTTSLTHMEQDLGICGFGLTEDDIARIESLRG